MKREKDAAHHDGRTALLDQIVRHAAEDGAFQLAETTGSDENQSWLEVIDEVDKHVSGVLCVYCLALDADVQPRALQEGSCFARQL